MWQLRFVMAASDSTLRPCLILPTTCKGLQHPINNPTCTGWILCLNRDGLCWLQYGELMALASMQQMLGLQDEAADSLARAEALQRQVLDLLWNPDIQYLGTYKVPAPPNFADSGTVVRTMPPCDLLNQHCINNLGADVLSTHD